MKDIIIFQGQITSPFFEQEIDFIKAKFNILAIIAYKSDIEATRQILKRHEIDENKLFMPRTRFCNPIKLIKWLLSTETKYEIKNCTLKGIKKLKRLCYVLIYGIYAISVEECVKKLEIHSNNLVLYSFWASRNAYAAACLKTKKFKKAITVCRAHSFDLYETRNDMNYLPFRAFINKTFNRICFISEHGKRHFTSKYPEPKNKFVFYLGTQNKNNIQKQVLQKSEICIASCSNLIQIKRLDLIIKALAGLNGIRVRWLCIGRGELINSIKCLAEKQLLNTTIKYEFLGYVENSKILSTYKKYDVDFIINLSDSEGLPVSLIEAFSAGIPAIARSVGGVNEIVSSSTGLLLDEVWSDDNLEKIKAFISCRINDVDKYKAYSAACYALWNNKFNACKNHTEFFNSIG